MVKDIFVHILEQSEEIFQPYKKEHDSVKDTGEKGKNHVTLTWKFPWKSCSTSCLPYLSPNPKILKAFWKLFLPKWSLLNAQQKEKKWGEKSEKRGEERKLKVKVKTAVSLLNPKTRDFAFCAAWTLQANILHQDQKAMKCTTCKWLYGKF